MSPAEVRYSSKKLTGYLDRLRHAAPGVRYVAALESHKDGTPHWHLLLYERGDVRLSWRAIARRWTRGFLKANVVRDDERASVYVAKYLAKSLARVRASRQFGTPLGPSRAMAAPEGRAEHGVWVTLVNEGRKFRVNVKDVDNAGESGVDFLAPAGGGQILNLLRQTFPEIDEWQVSLTMPVSATTPIGLVAISEWEDIFAR